MKSREELGALCAAAQTGDDAAVDALCGYFLPYIRATLFGSGIHGEDARDCAQDVIQALVDTLRSAKMREGERLPAFVQTLTKRRAGACIGQRISERARVPQGQEAIKRGMAKSSPGRQTTLVFDESGLWGLPCPRQTPEEAYLSEERRKVMHRALLKLREQDRDILIRFYVQEQSAEQIMKALGLSDTQFRLHKSRAKAKFGEIGKGLLRAGLRR